LEAAIGGIEASWNGIPTAGLLKKLVADEGNDFGGGDAGDDTVITLNSKSLLGHKSRQIRANEAACDQKMGAITNHLGTPTSNPQGYQSLHALLASFMSRTLSTDSVHEALKNSLGPVSRNTTGWNAYHSSLDKFLMNVTNEATVTFAGRPTSRRMTACWEGGTGRRSAVEPNAAGLQRPEDWMKTFKGRTQKSAQDYIGRFGAVEKWIVEVVPSKDHSSFKYGDR
jgi:hypothetical protein